MPTIAITRNTTLPDSSDKSDFHNLVDTATIAMSDFDFDGKAFTINDSGGAYDTRIEGDTNANLFFVDASEDRVGIGTNAPECLFDIQENGGDTIMGIRTFSTTDGDNASLRFYKSASGTLGTQSETGDNEELGAVAFFGCNDSDVWTIAAQIKCLQNGAAAAGAVNADLLFYGRGSGSTLGFAVRDHAHAPVGIAIGTDQDANMIDDGTHGSGSTTLYIGNETIDTTAVSDERLKENATDQDVGLLELLQLETKKFKYKKEYSDDTGDHYGLMAQAVETVFPYAVKQLDVPEITDEDGKKKKKYESVQDNTLKVVDYKRLIPLIIKSIQELNAKVEAM